MYYIAFHVLHNPSSWIRCALEAEESSLSQRYFTVLSVVDSNEVASNATSDENTMLRSEVFSMRSIQLYVILNA